MELTAIGKIEAVPENQETSPPIRRDQCLICLKPGFSLGLEDLPEGVYIQALIAPARPAQDALATSSDRGRNKGTFITRHALQPSGLQVVTLRLLGIEANELWVEGPSLRPGSPVYDLMPLIPALDAPEVRLEDQEQLELNPRQDFVRSICAGDRARLLVKAAEIHGHFCPGVAVGVMAALYGLRSLGVETQVFDGIMEDLLAIVELNACFVDGIQAVSGCTLGNNALIYRDLGRMAVTFTRRGLGKGFRVRLRADFKDLVNRLAPEFYPLMEKVIMQRKGGAEDMDAFREQGRRAAFGLIELDFTDIFRTQWVSPQLPDYAPISPLVTCPRCNEAVLATKTVTRGETGGMCLACTGQPAWQVDGRGIVRQQPI